MMAPSKVLRYKSSCNNAIVTVASLLFCVTGCGFQLSQVGKVYFSYKSRADLTISLAVKLQLPYISLCFRFMDLIDKFEQEAHNNSFNSRELNGVNGDWYYKFWSTLKIREIFNYTPPIDDLVLSCFIRNEKNLWIVDANSKQECLKKIKSAKYIHRELICYKIDPFINNETIESLPVANSIEFYNSQFMIVLNHTSFKRALFMASFVHIPGSSEYIDSTQNKLEVLSDDEEKGDFFVWYTTVTLNKLPPPFDTACEQGLSNTTGTEIGLQCMNVKLKRKFEKVFPFPHLYNYNSNDTLLSAHDLATNPAIANEVSRQRTRCIRSRIKCKLLHTQSYVSIRTGKRGSNIYVYIPITTTFSVDSTPNMVLMDFVIYMCSCLGIWIGFSVWQSFKCIFGISSNTNRPRVLSESEYDQLMTQLESNRIINEQLFDAVHKTYRFHLSHPRIAKIHRRYYIV